MGAALVETGCLTIFKYNLNEFLRLHVTINETPKRTKTKINALEIILIEKEYKNEKHQY